MPTPSAGHDDSTETLRARLAEATETLRAIRQGDVDALIVQVEGSDQVYTLHTADEPYRDLVEQMQEGAVVLTVSGDILYCNARFADLVGEPLETVIGAHIDRFVHPSVRKSFQALLTARSGRRSSQLIGPGGGAIEVHLSLTASAPPLVDRLSLIVTDLRELHEAYGIRDRAERDSRMKDEFLAMLAHELRSPLGAINTAVRVLHASDGPSQVRARDVIARQVAHLSHLIDDLLDVERVLLGKIQLHRRPIEMADVVRRAVGGFIDDVGLKRCIDISTEPVWVDGDAVRIEQVLNNLVSNAVKYTTAGSRILVALRGAGPDAVLTVEDTGVGIRADLLPFIFDMFIQGDRTLDRTQGGLGIGLTLVRRLVDLHGGTITASSAGEGRGSVFTVRLPRVPAADATPGHQIRPARANSRRVLLIEDNDDAREMFRVMLELAGHVVFDASDGVRGLAVTEAERPDVAIIDIGLPGMDGYQIARRIRERPYGPSMLLLALTGYGFPSDHQRSAEAGFDRHLIKPVDPDELLRLLGGESKHVAV